MFEKLVNQLRIIEQDLKFVGNFIDNNNNKTYLHYLNIIEDYLSLKKRIICICESNGHNFGKWEHYDSLNDGNIMSRTCSICGITEYELKDPTKKIA